MLTWNIVEWLTRNSEHIPGNRKNKNVWTLGLKNGKRILVIIYFQPIKRGFYKSQAVPTAMFWRQSQYLKLYVIIVNAFSRKYPGKNFRFSRFYIFECTAILFKNQVCLKENKILLKASKFLENGSFLKMGKYLSRYVLSTESTKLQIKPISPGGKNSSFRCYQHLRSKFL